MTIFNFTGMVRLVVCAAAVLLLLNFARADQILLTHPDSLTTYKPTSATSGQNVRPLVLQRGVNLDGSQRAGGGFAWALAANPFESRQPGEMVAGIRGSTGTYSPTEIDLTFPALVPWVVGRTYNARQELSSSHHNSDGFQGRNWFQISQPEIVFYDDATNTNDVVYLIYGADRFVEFQRTGLSDNTFRGVNGAAGIFQYVSGSPDIWIYYDQVGNRTYFFGGNAGTVAARWQIWKFVNPAGDTAFVGDASSATAADDDYYTTDHKAYDSADRRYSYNYSSGRLNSVTVETQSGGTWASPGTITEVGKVEYSYYGSSESNGDAGNLKLVTVSSRLSKPSTGGAPILTQKQYYRYYTAGASSTPYAIKMMVGFEGTRRFDWQGASPAHTFDDEFLSATDANLEAYSDVYFEYDSSYRVTKVFANGECGCGSSINGAYLFTRYSDTNPNFGTPTSNYELPWQHRVVVEPPTGGAWVTQYYDEVGQPLSRILSDSIPTSATNIWATKIVRNGSGQTTEVHTPANATGYAHNTGGGSPDGTISSSGSAGLVYYYQRQTSGDDTGFVNGVRQKEGDTNLSSNSTFMTWTDYELRSLNITGSISVTRPLVDTHRLYHTETNTASGSSNYDESTVQHDWWDNTTASNVLYITLKKVTSVAPAVDTTKNGSGSPTSTERYIRQDGTTAFRKSARGIFAYTAYTHGQLTKQVSDAKTNDGSEYGADDPNSVWGVTETGDGLHQKTTFTYDNQGRLSETELPSGRTTMEWYAALGSRRPVTFHIPHFASYHGPARYTVTNQAGVVEDCLVIAIDDPVGSDPPEYWLSGVITGSSLDDPIQSFVGGGDRSLVRLTHSVYNETGQRLISRGVSFTMPSTIASISTSNTDTWTVEYDDLGRQVRMVDPTSTIGLTNYDVLSRVTSRQVGTNDALVGGTDDMVTTEAMVYDGGAAGGNSHLTQTTTYVEDSTTDQRITNYIYDYRGRLLVTNGPVAPYSVSKYDNRNRRIATGFYSATQTASTDPTATTSSDRVMLSKTFYDERGQVYESRRHKINQSSGNIEDDLQTLVWYDPDGQPIKADGEQLTKIRRDRLGRVIQSFVLASDDDSGTYTNIYDTTKLFAKVDGDYVLEEVQTAFDIGNRTVMQATISRKHNDTTTTAGPLDTTNDGGDADPLQFTVSDVQGRIQITAVWYDELDRPITTAIYGTNASTANVAFFDRDGLSAPAYTASGVLVSNTTYDADGTVLELLDPENTKTKYEYDNAGRRTAKIASATGAVPPISAAVRDTDVYTRYTYANTLQTEMWVDINGDGAKDPDDQVTTYVYGTTKGTPGSGSPVQSAIADGSLLREVIYPEQTGGQSAADRTVTYAYNAQGQQLWTRDQEGNVIETRYDTGGREIHRLASNIVSGFDTTIQRITTAYLPRGMVDTVTQYDDDNTGSGNVKDQVQYVYDGWGNLSSFDQDVDSAIGVSGRASFAVAYAYAKNTSGRNTLRRSGMTLPGSTSVGFDYLSTSGKLDADSSRVSQITVSSTTVAKYEYLGAAQVVGTDLPQASARWQYYEGGSSGDPYPDLDQFNRVTDSRWTGYKTSGTRNFYDVDVTYDKASNITSIVDNVMKAGVSGNRNFDVQYTLDELYRLKRAQEGTFGGSSITNQSRDEQWQKTNGDLALSQTGNWLNHLVNLNNDSDYIDTGEMNDAGTFSLANELKTRDTDSNGTANYTLTYDKDGNLTSDNQTYNYVYDAFGRLKQVNKIGSGTVAEYTYNGLGYRTGWHYDANSSNAVDSSDPWYYWCHDNSWRQVATFRGNDSDPKEVFLHHLAGMGGYGRSSYIDSLILRDRDANTAWTSSADSTREERRYYCQNWRNDVSAVLTSDGKMVEWIKYSSYGIPYALPAGDTDSDGDWDATDSGNITVAFSYNVRLDANLDGSINSSDNTHANSIAGGYQALGRGKLSSSAVANRRAYAGYEYDVTFNGAGRHLFHIRNRAYDAEVGRWMRRDPLGYVDGMGLYEYVKSRPVTKLDPTGYQCTKSMSQLECIDDCVSVRYPQILKKTPGAAMECKLSLHDALKVCCQARFFLDPKTNKWRDNMSVDFIDCVEEAKKVYAACAEENPAPEPPQPTKPPPNHPVDPTTGTSLQRPPQCFIDHCLETLDDQADCIFTCHMSCDTRDVDACASWCMATKLPKVIPNIPPRDIPKSILPAPCPAPGWPKPK